MSGVGRRARVTLTRRRMSTIRVSLGAMRWMLALVAAAGLAAAVRDVVAPIAGRAVRVASVSEPDTSGQWFALRFARAYLTWSGDPGAQQAALAPFLHPSDDPSAGVTPAPTGAETIRSLAVASDRLSADGAHEVTVAAQVGPDAWRYLVVPVALDGGSPVLAHYPALVAGPLAGRAGALDGAALPTLANAQAIAMLQRALRNYVTGSEQNLAADLAPGARIEAAAPGLALRSIERLAVEPSGSVLATVTAADAGGAAFTLAYTVELAELDGRWEITGLHP